MTEPATPAAGEAMSEAEPLRTRILDLKDKFHRLHRLIRCVEMVNGLAELDTAAIGEFAWTLRERTEDFHKDFFAVLEEVGRETPA